MTSPGGGLALNSTTGIVSVRVTTERKRRRSGKPEAKFRSEPKIPENPLDGLPM